MLKDWGNKTTIYFPVNPIFFKQARGVISELNWFHSVLKWTANGESYPKLSQGDTSTLTMPSCFSFPCLIKGTKVWKPQAPYDTYQVLSQLRANFFFLSWWRSPLRLRCSGRRGCCSECRRPRPPPLPRWRSRGPWRPRSRFDKTPRVTDTDAEINKYMWSKTINMTYAWK